MKALVLSDSHGATRTLQALMERLEREGKPDALLYCGDGLSDILPYRAWCPTFYAVRGNCDFTAPPDVAGELTARIGGVEVLLAHGNGYHVKRSLETLNWRARELEARVVCFGHTHWALAEWHHGVLMLNPGALHDGRYAMLDIRADGVVVAELLSV